MIQVKARTAQLLGLRLKLSAALARIYSYRFSNEVTSFMISGIRAACALSLLVFLMFCLGLGMVSAQAPPSAGSNAANEMPSVTTVPPEAQPSPNFSVEAATDAYMARIPASARARSDTYFEGGYWLILWDFLYGAVIALLLLLNLRWSAAMRNLAERITRFKPLQTFLYWFQYSVVTFVLGAPLAIYEGYTREHQYGLATHTFDPVGVRPGQGPDDRHRAGRNPSHVAVRHRAPPAAHLVDIGSGRDSGVIGLGGVSGTE